MTSVRGGAGLGDAVYIQSVVRHLIESGRERGPIEVCTEWPEVFRPLNGHVVLSPFRRKNITRLAHYSTRRGVAGTTQFDDMCLTAGLRLPIPLRLDWKPEGNPLARLWNPNELPIVVVQMPRPPFGRSDGFGAEFLPDCRRIQDVIEHLDGRVVFVQVGAGEPLFKYQRITLDLSNQTTVSGLLDVGLAADGFLGQCSFIIPIAESFDKPALLVWSRRGLNSRHEVIRQMTPQKILHKRSSRSVIDDCSDRELMEAADAFCDALRVPAVV